MSILDITPLLRVDPTLFEAYHLPNIQQHQFTIFNYHVYRHGVYGVHIDIIIFKVITIRHERITTRHK